MRRVTLTRVHSESFLDRKKSIQEQTELKKMWHKAPHPSKQPDPRLGKTLKSNSVRTTPFAAQDCVVHKFDLKSHTIQQQPGFEQQI